MTFENYFVNNFKIEGTVLWTNTSTTTITSWRREVINGKITGPGGRFWLHSGVREITHTHGSATPRIHLDDVFNITGNSSVTNSNGLIRTATIILPLQKKFICRFIDKGRIRLEGPNHFAVLDFGNGICDDEAIISIDGHTPHTIYLH
jgi:hypothetical protein